MRRLAVILMLVVALVAWADLKAVTEDGRTVILCDDGTWAYASTTDSRETAEFVTIGDSGATLEVLGYRDNVEEGLFKPDSGMKLFGVEIRIDGVQSTVSLGLNWMLGWGPQMRDTAGYLYRITMASLSRLTPEFPAVGDVDPGDILRGWVTFEVRKEVTPVQLQVRFANDDAKSRWVPVAKE